MSGSLTLYEQGTLFADTALVHYASNTPPPASGVLEVQGPPTMRVRFTPLVSEAEAAELRRAIEDGG